ncbi:WD40-repeat-containing domain protein [Rhodotorula diobovata]|uniref:WD40-repeat-containing domain protein n=1 Tax=Rhodotorula diobovata TaxID=5288 RepID=A0A5C5FZ45_9BASI|nr:WD40-repeat-containing domain protein [Rhodotorula diobovata]
MSPPPPPPPTVVVLPRTSIQPSLPLVLADISHPHSTIAAEDAWISLYPPSGPSTHARIRVSEGDDPRTCHVDSLHPDAVSVHLAASLAQLAVTWHTPSDAGTLSTVVTALLPSPRLNPLRPSPSRTTANPTSLDAPSPALLSLPSSIDAFALSPRGDRIAIAGRDALARVVDLVPTPRGGLEKGREQPLRGHVGDVVACEWAPSGEVVLTAASDMTVRVWSAADGSSPRSAALPPSRPTSLVPLLSPSPSGPHKGRHLLHASQAGTLTLVDLSPAPPALLRTWRTTRHAAAGACVVVSVWDCGASAGQEEEDPQDVGKGRYALVGGADGAVRVVALSPPADPAAEDEDPPILCRAPGGSPIETMHALPSSSSSSSAAQDPHPPAPAPHWTLALGTRDGLVAVYDVPLSALVAPSPSPSPSASSHPHPRELAPRAAWRRSPAPDPAARIASVRLSRRGRTSAAAVGSGAPPRSVLVAPADGLAYRAGLASGSGSGEEEQGERDKVWVEEEFVGLDCEPATGVAEDREGRVWVSGAGILRPSMTGRPCEVSYDDAVQAIERVAAHHVSAVRSRNGADAEAGDEAHDDANEWVDDLKSVIEPEWWPHWPRRERGAFLADMDRLRARVNDAALPEVEEERLGEISPTLLDMRASFARIEWLVSRILSYSPTPHWFDYVTDRVTLAEYDDEDAMMRLNVEGEVLALLDTLGHHVSVHTGEPVQTGEPQTLVRLLAAVPSVPRERVRVPTLLRRAPAQPSLGDSKHFYWLNELLASVHAQRQIRERRLAQEWRRKDRARRQKSTRGGLHTRVGKPGPSLASSREAAQRKHRDDTLLAAMSSLNLSHPAGRRSPSSPPDVEMSSLARRPLRRDELSARQQAVYGMGRARY